MGFEPLDNVGSRNAITRIVCRIFSKAWETDRTRSEIIASHSYFVGDERYGRPSFPRFEKFMAAQPRRHPIKPCKCGRPDRWKCWSKFYARQLLGQARAARGVRFKTDWEILDDLRGGAEPAETDHVLFDGPIVQKVAAGTLKSTAPVEMGDWTAGPGADVLAEIEEVAADSTTAKPDRVLGDWPSGGMRSMADVLAEAEADAEDGTGSE